MLFTLGFILLLIIGEFTGVIMANFVVDIAIHETLYIVAQVGLK